MCKLAPKHLLDQGFWSRIESFLPKEILCIEGNLKGKTGIDPLRIRLNKVDTNLMTLEGFINPMENLSAYNEFEAEFLTLAGMNKLKAFTLDITNTQGGFSPSLATQLFKYRSFEMEIYPPSNTEEEILLCLPIFRVRIAGDSWSVISASSEGSTYSELEIEGQKAWWIDFTALGIKFLGNATGVLVGPPEIVESLKWMIQMGSGVQFHNPVKFYLSNMFKPIRILIHEPRDQRLSSSNVLYLTYTGLFKEYIDRCFQTFRQRENEIWQIKQLVDWHTLIFETHFKETKALLISVLFEALKDRYAQISGYTTDDNGFWYENGVRRGFIAIINNLLNSINLQLPQELNECLKEIRNGIIHEGRLSRPFSDVLKLQDLITVILFKLCDYPDNKEIHSFSAGRRLPFIDFQRHLGLIQ